LTQNPRPGWTGVLLFLVGIQAGVASMPVFAAFMAYLAF
jgi:hypothetical protein